MVALLHRHVQTWEDPDAVRSCRQKKEPPLPRELDEPPGHVRVDEGDTENETSTADLGGDERGEELREAGKEGGEVRGSLIEARDESRGGETGEDVVRESGAEDVATEGGSVRA